ncbi:MULTISPECIES: AI-2E family transporter [Flavobacterium]|jgi:predicted PurR-regulated permease PerM|uniref:AI-2E family transporter n=2 Tax=Flavobacterium TaxID=237 RepID=A0ABU9I7A5_9FLAO|nr:AI-2E family transporter [Flavobacterium cheniae]TDR25551.1 putative PurR-regulated permease PerM [Flavobacterium cheniae]TWH98263.1 putative PurR-regulated permease PerM [Flavobacterium cheniae]
MTSKELSIGIVRAVAILVASCLVLFFLYQITTVILYCIIAIVISLLLNPLVNFLKQRFKFRNTLAVISSLLIAFLIISGFVLLFVPLLLAQGENLSLLDVSSLEKNYHLLLENITVFLDSYNINTKQLIQSSKLSSFATFEFIPNFLNSFLSTLGSFSMGFASVLFITFFLLKEKDVLYLKFKRLLPENQKEKVLNSIQDINHLLSRYFLGLLLQLTIIMLLYLIIFIIFGVENAIIIALLCAIFNIVPYVGPLIASIVAGLLIMTSGIGSGADFATETLPTAIYVLIGMSLVQVIDNNFSSPLIFSKSTNSHPLEIFLVILIAGILFGITGMIIAVPFYTSLKVIGKEFLPNNKIIKALTKNL